MKGYLTVKGEYESVTIIERSKFICNLKGIETEEEALLYIDEIKKRHAFATHGCYAYVADELGNICKFSDAGEPQGTAGMPMLNALKGKDVKKVVAVVTRYFGGIKLGAGGLVRAYGGSVSNGINGAKLVYMSPANYLKISTDYDLYSALLKIITVSKGVIISTEYDAKITVLVALNAENEGDLDVFSKKLADLYKGNPEIELIKKDYFSFEV